MNKDTKPALTLDALEELQKSLEDERGGFRGYDSDEGDDTKWDSDEEEGEDVPANVTGRPQSSSAAVPAQQPAAFASDTVAWECAAATNERQGDFPPALSRGAEPGYQKTSEEDAQQLPPAAEPEQEHGGLEEEAAAAAAAQEEGTDFAQDADDAEQQRPRMYEYEGEAQNDDDDDIEGGWQDSSFDTLPDIFPGRERRRNQGLRMTRGMLLDKLKRFGKSRRFASLRNPWRMPRHMSRKHSFRLQVDQTKTLWNSFSEISQHADMKKFRRRVERLATQKLEVEGDTCPQGRIRLSKEAVNPLTQGIACWIGGVLMAVSQAAGAQIEPTYSKEFLKRIEQFDEDEKNRVRRADLADPKDARIQWIRTKRRRKAEDSVRARYVIRQFVISPAHITRWFFVGRGQLPTPLRWPNGLLERCRQEFSDLNELGEEGDLLSAFDQPIPVLSSGAYEEDSSASSGVEEEPSPKRLRYQAPENDDDYDRETEEAADRYYQEDMEGERGESESPRETDDEREEEEEEEQEEEEEEGEESESERTSGSADD